jgi:small-conductance mechanosensitive channel
MTQYKFADWWNAYPWLETGSSAIIAVIVMLIALRVGTLVIRRLAQPSITATTVLRHVARPLRYLLPLAGLQIVWNSAPPDLHLLGLVRHINSLLLIAAITWLGMQSIAGVGSAIEVLNPISIEDNLQARRIHTQSRVMLRVMMSVVMLIGLSSVLMTFPGIRQIGISLLASAGVAGLVAGIAARPVLGNLIAGLQIALTQPIRLDDVVIVQNEWGWIEEITSTYVVIRLWDQRRLVVPLQWFIENPFQNWTRTNSQIIGSVFLWVDYRMPLEPLREETQRICDSAPDWDRRVCLMQITDTTEYAMQLRVLASSTDSPRNWDLRCLVREGLISFIQSKYPEFLPTVRAVVSTSVATSPLAMAVADNK